MRYTDSGQRLIPVDQLGNVVRKMSFADATPAHQLPKRLNHKRTSDALLKSQQSSHNLSASQTRREAINVVLRVRPLSDAELAKSETVCVLSAEKSDNVLHIEPKDPSKHPIAIRNAGKATFKFSSVFREHATQEQVFEHTALPLIEGLFQGNSAVVFAYGVTCSGKTWTIQGSNKHPGILPRALDVIVNSIAVAKGQGLQQDVVISQGVQELTEHGGRKRRRREKAAEKVHDSNYLEVKGAIDYKIFASYLEVYNENCFDLFEKQPSKVKDEPVIDTDPTRPSDASLGAEGERSSSSAATRDSHRNAVKRRILKLKEDSHGEVFAEGQTEIEIQSGADIDRLLEFGQQNRTVAHTQANEHSSRSHAVFIITLKQSETIPQPRGPSKILRTSAKLHIVDLAGSERTSKTNASGSRLKEARQINTSLMNLGRCLTTLRQNQRSLKKDPSKPLRIVPFRQSRLTRLLQNSLSSGSAVMIANVSPALSDADETIQALRCAAIAREVTIAPASKKKVLTDCTNTISSRAATEAQNHKTPRGTNFVRTRGQRLKSKAPSNTESVYPKQLKEAEKQISSLQKEISMWKKETSHFKNEFEEAEMEWAAERKESDHELDRLFRENERLRDRLIDTEVRFRCIEAEIREEVSQEANKIISEIQERCDRQIRGSWKKEEEVNRGEFSAISETERMQKADQLAKRIARASVAAMDGIKVNFESYDDDEDSSEADRQEYDVNEYLEEDDNTYIEEEDEEDFPQQPIKTEVHAHA